MKTLVMVGVILLALRTPAVSQTDSADVETETAPRPPSVLDRALQFLKPRRVSPEELANSAMRLKMTARSEFEQGKPEEARKHLKALLDIYRKLYSSDRSTPGRYQWSLRLAEVAQEYLRGGQIADALTVLGEAADLELQRRSQFDDGLAGAAGQLNRRLIQLTTDERYELLLNWTMPSETRQRVRVLTSIVPTVAPPSVFARLLGERPRRNSFAVAEVGDVSGLFSTAWVLVQSAAGAGRLRRLTGELDGLSKQRIPNANFVLMLAQVAAESRGSDDLLLKALREQAAMLNDENLLPGASSATVSLSDMVIAAACLNRDRLQPVGEEMLKTMIERTFGSDAPLVLPFLRRAHAIAVQKRYADANVNVLESPNPQYWIATSRERALLEARGAVRETWLSHEDHILHLAGPLNDYLLFRYPLTGEFEFSCETLDGGKGRPEGGIGYGGLMFGAWGAGQLFKTWDVDYRSEFHRKIPFVPNLGREFFHSLSLKTTADGITTFSANGHSIWSDTSKDTASPWIGLRSLSDHASIFRNLRIIGTPVIPREVRLSDGDTLRGWLASYYEESAPAVLPTDPIQTAAQQTSADDPLQAVDLDWYGKNGVIHSKKGGEGFSMVTQSRLTYFRPLQNGESLSYEFLYEPGRYGVHPALGRLAFLIEPNGVRIHWMTTGDSDWTGLPDDNALIEPFSRRGPKPLPLVPGDWNRVTLSLEKEILTLSLNETTIYSRKMDTESKRTFAFYHNRNRTAVRVRNVVLRGDWPETLPAEKLNNLAAVSGSKRTTTDRRALGAIFDDTHIVDAALDVHRRAAKMPLKQRYQFLTDWVLPGIDHDTIRVALGFTPTHPSPPVHLVDRIDLNRLRIAEQTGLSRVQSGGQLVAPALDLVGAAKELGKLEELRERLERTIRIDRVVSVSDQQQRSRLALLVIIDIARKDFDAALNEMDRLFALAQSGKHPDYSDNWPEMLVVKAAVQHAELHDVVHDMAYYLLVSQLRLKYPSGNDASPFQIIALMGMFSYFDLKKENTSIERFGMAPALKQWASVNDSTARTRGTGRPPSHWQLRPGSVEILAGHDKDYLYFQSPLRGNYAVECDVTAYGWRDSYLSVAGAWVAPVSNLMSYRVGSVSFERPRGKITPKLTRPKEWHRLRTVVRNGVSTTYVNGRKIHEEPLPDDHVPWLAIRSLMRSNGITRNLRITGAPVIPDRLRLTATEDLSGWMPYFAETAGRRTSHWRQQGDLPNGGGIVGLRQPEMAGSAIESLLCYHRPMLEDGTIEYDFYYRNGEAHTHPALDRLAFILDPEGVRVHWITDGPYDRTGLSPQNFFDEPQNRRGSGQFPLKQNAWNHLELKLTGDIVELTLNDQPVYQRKLEPTNQRTFGLFHYADQTEVRVRNVVWRGDWPRHLPSIPDQELAGDGADFLDEKLPELTAVFEHDFAKDGFPEDRFTVFEPGWQAFVTEQQDGVHVTRSGAKNRYFDYSIAPRCTVKGDFDVTASYKQFEPSQPTKGVETKCSLFLSAVLNDKEQTRTYIYRRHVRGVKLDPAQLVQGMFSQVVDDQTRRTYFGSIPFEAEGGTLRLSRRGNTMYFLVAEEDSSNFRLIGEETFSGVDLHPNGIRIHTQTYGPGVTRVVWTNITIRATDITGLSLGDPKEIIAQLNQQRDAMASRFDHDFARDDPTEERLHRWGHTRPLLRDAEGLRVVARGSDNWVSTGLAPQVALRGDFDVAVSLDVLKIDKPKVGQNSSVYLQVELGDSIKTSSNLILVYQPDGGKELHVQMKSLNSNGKYVYRLLRVVNVDSIGSLRIARRGKLLSLLIADSGSDKYRIISQTETGSHDVPSKSIRLMVHAGGTGRETEVLYKHLRIHADEINPLIAETVALRQALANQLTGKLPASALEFDGRSQYVTIESIRYDGSHPITLEAFVTPDNLQGIVIGDTQQSGVDIGFRSQNYNMHAWNGKGYDFAVSPAVANRFLRVHLAGVFDGETLKLFINGKLSKTTRHNGKFSGSGFPMTIGASPSPREIGIDFPFAGVIDQVRISNKIRYTKDFDMPAEFKADASTLAVFRFDEGKGATLRDSSGNKHHGEIRNAKWVGDSAIRHRAALGLVDLGQQAVGVLAEALKHSNPDVRLEAATALGMIGKDAKPSVPALKLAEGDDDPRVRNAAKQSLALIESNGGILQRFLKAIGASR